MENKIKELKKFLDLVNIVRPKKNLAVPQVNLAKYHKGKLIYNNLDCQIEYKLEEKLFKKDCLINLSYLSFYLKNYLFLDIDNIKQDEAFFLKYKSYFTFKKYKEKNSYEIEDLQSIIKYTIPFISKDKSRYYLTGIYFDKNNLVATNGHILIKYQSDCKFNDSFILSTEICKILTNLKDDISFYYNKDTVCQKVMFKNDKVKIISKIIDGEYPNYNNVIKPCLEYKKKLFIEVDDYKFMNLMSMINFNKNSIKIKGKEYIFKINHKMKGLFNGKYIKNIIDIAKKYKYKEVNFASNQEYHPLLAKVDNCTLLIMPLRN